MDYQDNFKLQVPKIRTIPNFSFQYQEISKLKVSMDYQENVKHQVVIIQDSSTVHFKFLK